MKKFVLSFATLALAVASAANNNRYNVKLFLPGEVGGQAVKAGEYKLELTGSQAVLKGINGASVQADARVQEGDKKFSQTVVKYSGNDANAKIEEIRIGGTSKTVVFTKGQVSGN